MKNLSLTPLFLFTIALSILLSGCKEDECPDGNYVVINGDCVLAQSGIYADILENLSNKVIIKSYTDFSGVADFMKTSTQTFIANPNQSNLNVVRDAWLSNRGLWERSEAFLFGPATTESLASSIDTWPVFSEDISTVLSGNDAITEDFLNSEPGELKGFHTLEYLLWGEDGSKTANDFTDREFEYLQSCVGVLASDASKLLMTWSSTGDDFGTNLINAGLSGSIYTTQEVALLELTNGLLWITTDVSSRKMNEPLSQEDMTLVESQFSHNSKFDLINNIRSVQNIYLGVNGEGLSGVVIDVDPSADMSIKNALTNALSALEAIPGTFSDAIPINSGSRASAEFAQTSVEALKDELEGTLLPIISGL